MLELVSRFFDRLNMIYLTIMFLSVIVKSPHCLVRSLTATFSGKIEFSVVSTNGEKVFRKKKSIKVGK